MAMHRTQIFLPDDMRNWLRDRANEGYDNVSMVVRGLIRNEMSKRAERGRTRLHKFQAKHVAQARVGDVVYGQIKATLDKPPKPTKGLKKLARDTRGDRKKRASAEE
jgi:Arc/MetJ-type ribon-helix-helix transcriptional regulator